MLQVRVPQLLVIGRPAQEGLVLVLTIVGQVAKVGLGELQAARGFHHEMLAAESDVDAFSNGGRSVWGVLVGGARLEGGQEEEIPVGEGKNISAGLCKAASALDTM